MMWVDRIWRPLLAAVCALATLTAPQSPTVAGEAAVKAFQTAAYNGRFADGITKLDAMARTQPNDAEAVFGLGALRFFGAIVDLQEGLYRHTTNVTGQNIGGVWGRGLFPMGQAMGGVMLVPPNPGAKPMTYAKLRELLAGFAAGMARAEQTLAKVGERPVKLPLKPFDIAIDLNHNGNIEEHERILAALLGRGRRMRDAALGAELAFDTADASWLRGYAHVLMASANFMLAFDFEKSYDVAAHTLYGDKATAFGLELARQTGLGRPREIVQAELTKVQEEIRAINREKSSTKDIRELRSQVEALPDVPANAERRRLLQGALQTMTANQQKHRDALAQLSREQRRLHSERSSAGQGWIYDAVAFVHTLNWQVIEPQRLAATRRHLLQVMEINRNTWRLARAETDNDREWLPNAKQTPPFMAQPLTDEVIDSWLATTALAAQVLKGEKLLPHPRFKKGFNLRKLFENAKQMDFVLLATGHDLLPYLEDGDVVDQNTWNAITQPMGRHVGQYAIWFN